MGSYKQKNIKPKIYKSKKLLTTMHIMSSKKKTITEQIQ